jgi:hypothetical protein
MKPVSTLLAAASVLAASVLAAGPAAAQAMPPEIPFTASEFLKPPPDMHLGEIAGVAVNRDRHVFVFQRGNTSGPAYGAAASQLLEFGPDGRYLREIGKNLYAWSFAHNVRIDPQGNIWAADKGSDMVIRFNPQGRVTWVFGRKVEASDEGAHPLEHPNPKLPAVEGSFRQVTDMTWDSKGNTYISDGYINARVAKISPDGQWIGGWGTPGSGPGQFNTLHSIQADAQDRIYVADRGNRRIQVFDTEGKLLKIITIDVPAPPNAPTATGPKPPTDYAGVAAMNQPGAPWALCITPPANGRQLLYVADAYPGRIYKLSLEGEVLGMLGSSGRQMGQFRWIHEIACPSENELYVGELLNWRLQKLVLSPRP